MNPFIYSYPVKVCFGEKAAAKNLAAELEKVGPNVLLAYGGGSIKKNGVYDELMGILTESGKTVTEFTGIMSNPTYAKAQEGAVIRTLESAKGLMNEISASAEKRADIIMKNAQLSADQLLRSAQENVDRLKDEEKDLGYRVASIKNRFKNILQAELDGG